MLLIFKPNFNINKDSANILRERIYTLLIPVCSEPARGVDDTDLGAPRTSAPEGAGSWRTRVPSCLRPTAGRGDRPFPRQQWRGACASGAPGGCLLLRVNRLVPCYLATAALKCFLTTPLQNFSQTPVNGTGLFINGIFERTPTLASRSSGVADCLPFFNNTICFDMIRHQLLFFISKLSYS